jgi:hypothetical protein
VFCRRPIRAVFAVIPISPAKTISSSMKVPSSADLCSAPSRSNNIKLVRSPIGKQQILTAARMRVKSMTALTESVRLSLPVDLARQNLAENQQLCSGQRTIGIEVMVQIAETYGMKDNILACAMALHDMFLAAHSQDRAATGADTSISIQHRASTKLVAVACFMLANKFVGSSSLWIDDILDVVRLKCSSAEIESTEGMVLSSIDWSLHLATGEACLH